MANGARRKAQGVRQRSQEIGDKRQAKTDTEKRRRGETARAKTAGSKQ
ncbi:MAG: hypothetical protein PVH35_09025 [Syntrophobacterales bacterium]|jgi:hypothetical protein